MKYESLQINKFFWKFICVNDISKLELLHLNDEADDVKGPISGGDNQIYPKSGDTFITMKGRLLAFLYYKLLFGALSMIQKENFVKLSNAFFLSI